ncbi:ABC transporter substrate-binding protein [Paenibacillus oryzae]|uniref:ABC transporter substrate-binding protein n=1 Tax=Paenibacillus oryzae TaxID=1844972 RepID=A0A1A5YHA9_9BACL|nr:extracellular solute-binding protein [Paenibacillus oryzae]OBR64959.1 ABC transporter substrate-binding protein [Paenibacillus oryzae]
MKPNNMIKTGLSKWVKTGMALTMVTGTLAACSGSNTPSDAENRVLRIGVLYGGSDSEPYFRQQYTDIYEYNHPNIKFEIVGAINYEDQRFQSTSPDEPAKQPDPYEKMKEMMTGQNPVDLVVIDYSMLRKFTQDNLLQPLDPLIAKDKFDLSDYVPTVIDGIKALGDNQVFALTPSFTSSALYYNKKIFADLGVEPPTDKMEWSEVFAKARQVANGEGEDRTFGFMLNRWSSDPYSDVQNYANALQLKMWDDKAENMMVNSEQWIKATEQIVSLYDEKIVPNQEFMNQMYEKISNEGGSDPFYGDLFVQGKVAMMVSDSTYVNELKKFSDNAASISNFEMVDWDIVTVPTSPNNPSAGGNIGLSQLMGINAKAQNAADAWEFIKFSNSKEWAKLKSRSNYELVARKEFLLPVGGMSYNIDAFTLLTPLPPATTNMDNIYSEKPNIWEVSNIGYQLFENIRDGSKTVAEAMAEWETRGNAILQGQSESGEGGGVARFSDDEEAKRKALEAASGEAEAEPATEATEETTEQATTE